MSASTENGPRVENLRSRLNDVAAAWESWLDDVLRERDQLREQLAALGRLEDWHSEKTASMVAEELALAASDAPDGMAIVNLTVGAAKKLLAERIQLYNLREQDSDALAFYDKRGEEIARLTEENGALRAQVEGLRKVAEAAKSLTQFSQPNSAGATFAFIDVVDALAALPPGALSGSGEMEES